MLIDKLFAGIAFAMAMLLLLRLVLGERRRAALGRAWRRSQNSWRRRWTALTGPRRTRSAERAAEKMANDAIQRARDRGVRREGNVLKPKAFRKPRKDRNLH